MVLGCMLCRKALVSYVRRKRVNWAKAGLSSRLPSCWDEDQAEQKLFQLLSSPCGHVFHKHCLKTLFAGHFRKTTGKPCPVCNKSFKYERCFPVQLSPEADAVGQEMKSLLSENDELQKNLLRLKSVLKKRQTELGTLLLQHDTEAAAEAELTQEARVNAPNNSGTQKHWNQAAAGRQERLAQSSGEEVLAQVSAYSDLNQRLAAMIQQSLEMQTALWHPRPAPTRALSAQKHEAYSEPAVSSSSRVPAGQFFGASPLRSQYVSYNNLTSITMSPAAPWLLPQAPALQEPSRPSNWLDDDSTELARRTFQQPPRPAAADGTGCEQFMANLTASRRPGWSSWSLSPGVHLPRRDAAYCDAALSILRQNEDPSPHLNKRSAQPLFDPRVLYSCLPLEPALGPAAVQTCRQNRSFFNESLCSCPQQPESTSPSKNSTLSREAGRPAFLTEMPSMENYVRRGPTSYQSLA